MFFLENNKIILLKIQCRRLNRENFSKYKDHERLYMYPLLSRDAGPVFVCIAKPSHNTPCEWLLMTRHVVDINLAYKITKRKLYTNVEYNFHHHCTYLAL